MLGRTMLTAALGLTAASLFARPSWSHGAFPQARQIATDPSDASRIWARTTFGVLTSSDSGSTWQWICTQAAGYSSTENPLLGVTGNGTVLAAVFDGLKASTDHGCSWAVPQPSLARTVTGLAVDSANPARALALISRGAGDGSYENELWRSDDAGKTFAQLGQALDSSGLILSVGVTPGDPQRVYLSGLFALGDAGAPVHPAVLTSTDGGMTFGRTELPTPPGDAPYIAGVHPKDAQKLYVRVDHASTSQGDLAKGTLLYSDDGGTTFSAVLEKSAVMLGFTLSPDGNQALVGFGDPKGSVGVEQADLGLYRGPLGQGSFTRVREGHVGCLTFVGAELWACLSQFEAGFEIGRSSDDGANFTEVMQLAGVEGPLGCPPASTTAGACEGLWEDACVDIGKCGGTAGAGGQSPTDGGQDGGCGCRTPSRPAAPALGAGLLVALLLLSTRRKRA